MVRLASSELLGWLETARRDGHLGPPPVEDHVANANGFADAIAQHLDEPLSGPLVDLGTGGGVPGLVLAEWTVDCELYLIEVRAKRAEFLRRAVRSLSWSDRVTVLEDRAETVGHGELRGRAQVVTARAFATPAATAECGAPLLARHGLLVVSEPPEPASDRWPSEHLALLGIERVSYRSSAVAVFVKRRAGEPRFPRRPGNVAKRPLWVSERSQPST